MSKKRCPYYIVMKWSDLYAHKVYVLYKKWWRLFWTWKERTPFLDVANRWKEHYRIPPENIIDKSEY